MRNKTRLLFAIAALLALSGCAAATTEPRAGDASGSPSPTATVTESPDATKGVPYSLYTHCGVAWAKIRGGWWHADPELNDGSGNPPDGWGNPYQQGTLTFRSPDTAVFTSPAGSATFRRTDRTEPPYICS